MKEETLSEKRKDLSGGYSFYEEDVAEAVKKLKEEFKGKFAGDLIIQKIDKIFGSFTKNLGKNEDNHSPQRAVGKSSQTNTSKEWGKDLDVQNPETSEDTHNQDASTRKDEGKDFKKSLSTSIHPELINHSPRFEPKDNHDKRGCGKFLFWHYGQKVNCGDYSCGLQLCPECSKKGENKKCQ